MSRRRLREGDFVLLETGKAGRAHSTPLTTAPTTNGNGRTYSSLPAVLLTVPAANQTVPPVHFDDVKTEVLLREETIRSKSPEAVAQEIFGVLLAYNLVRLEAENIANEAGVEATQISFVAVLRFVVEQWEWAAITSRFPTPPALPAIPE